MRIDSLDIRGALLAASLAVSPASSPASDFAFQRVKLHDGYYSDGINAGDVNGDGSPDIVAGPYWYAGPSFTQKFAFRAPRSTPFPDGEYSDCYAVFVHDVNSDGWPDILSLRQTGGTEIVWYENPKGAAGYWVERSVFSSVHNESPAFADVDGDGKPELVTNSGRYGGWVSPDWNSPASPWTFRSVTQQAPEAWNWGPFTHGSGVGDVNGDGRADLLFPQGWWEQPANPSSVPWTHHPADFWGQELAAEGRGGAHMHVTDVDGDGDNDVITSLQAHGWGLAWFENQGGQFVRRMIMNTRADTALYGVAFPQLHALALGDMDGDGLADIVTGKRRGTHGNGLSAEELDAPAPLYVFRLERPAGEAPRFVPHLVDSSAGVGTQVVVADVDGDGRPDILTASRQGAFLFLNRTPTSLRPGLRKLPAARAAESRDALGRARDPGDIPYFAAPARPDQR